MTADMAFFEAFLEEQEQIKQRLPASIKALYFKETIQESAVSGPPARCISVRTQSVIPQSWQENLDGVLTRSQGFDHIHRMFKSCAKNVALGYLGPYCSRAVAEHALTTMLVLMKRFKSQIQQFHRFHRDGLTGKESSRRRVLIFGVGQIGTEIAKLCQAWDMQVKGVDINPRWGGIEYVDLDEGLRWAEIVFCAAPLTKRTERIFNYQSFGETGSIALFINVSRGEISPVEDLMALLEEKRLLGVGLDVYPDEKRLGEKMRAGDADDPYVRQMTAFANHPKVICTPHNAFNTEEALERKITHTIDSVVAFFDEGRFPFPIPPEMAS